MAKIDSTPVESATAAPQAHSESNRIAGLDALRGLAALAVLLFHYTCFTDFEGTRGLIVHVPWGNYGVQLFFIISGYVILLTVRRSGSAREFVISRFARLYPVFWVACVLTYSAIRLFAPQLNDITLRDAARNLLMFEQPHVKLIEGAYWTLRQELWFYVVMAALLAIRRVDFAFWMMSILVFTSICDLKFTRWFGLFLIGMVLYDSREAFKLRHMFFLSLCAIDVLRRSLWKTNSDVHGWQYPLAILLCAALVFAATRLRLPWLNNRVLLFLGMISYSLYLLHATIGQIIIMYAEKAGLSTNSAVGVAIASAIALASTVTFLVEKPALRAIKARLGVKRSRSPGVRIPAASSPAP